MKTWEEIQKAYNTDSKIFEILSIILNEDISTNLLITAKYLKLPKSLDISLYEIVFARQLFLNKNRDAEELKIFLHLLTEQDFRMLAVEALEALLDNFKAR